VAVWVRHVRRIPRDLVSRFLIPRAQAIVDTPRARSPDELGSRYFGGDIRDLCACVTKGTSSEGILLGYPLLLHLWSYECLPVGRPYVIRDPYDLLPPGHDPTDRPTMGSLWCRPVRTSYIFSLIFIKFGRS
jgi:hypothetical protein